MEQTALLAPLDPVTESVAPTREEIIAADRDRAVSILRGLTVIESRIEVVVIEGDPCSKARPRFVVGKNGKPMSYSPRRTIEGEERIKEAVAPLFGAFDANVAISALFYRRTFQRVDIDNLEKAVLDGCTKAQIWRDDSQVTALASALEHDAEFPRSVIAFAQHSSSMRRGDAARSTCESCGELFEAPGKRRGTARWCSRECRMTLAEPIPCEVCEKPFKRRSGNQKMCSEACRRESIRRRERRPVNECVDCGESTSANPSAVRCRECWKKHMAAEKADRLHAA